MAVLGFDLFLFGFVLLVIGMLLWGWVRGDLDRRRASLFVGLFLTFVPLLGSNVADSAGLTGTRLWVVRGALAAVGVAGLVLAYRGYRMDEPSADAAENADTSSTS